MLRKQLKFGYHKEMYALQFKFICTTVLIVAYLSLCEAGATGQGRRRFGQTKTKVPVEEASDKATTTDQTLAATTKNASKKYRRDGTYSSSGDDYIYNTADINFIQPENKPLHSGTKIRTKYSSSITIPFNALEDTETAEEYVAKAVGMYGARFREPIRVSYEPEVKPTPQPAEILKYEQQPQTEKVNFQSEHLPQKYHQDFLPHNAKDEKRITEEQKQINNEYYTYYQKDVRHHGYAAEKEPTQTQQFYQYTNRPAVEHEQKANAEEQTQNQEQEYRQQERPQFEQEYRLKERPQSEQEYRQQERPQFEQEYRPKERPQSEQEYRPKERPQAEQEYRQQERPQLEQEYRPKERTQPEQEYRQKERPQLEQDYRQTERPQSEHEYRQKERPQSEQEYRLKERSQSEQVSSQKAQTYEKQNEHNNDEKEQMTRSYQIYEEQAEAQQPSQHLADDQQYRTKYVYKAVPQYQEQKEQNVQENEAVQDTTNETENEERVRVSAATEIPRAEIMKQIEKSVIKYMKELEAEGKIVTTTENQEPEPYFKVETITPSSVKRKNKKPSTKYATLSAEGATGVSATTKKYSKNSRPREEEVEEQKEHGHFYQAAGPQVDAVLTPNVEFVYKIKTQAPLHAATVKTVSKPYNLALKSFEQFDHSKALKNLQEFDLTHVVTTPDPDETGHQNAQQNNLYFNSEIYHDLQAKSVKQKPKKETEYHPDYENYAASQSQGGYYAEPPAEREAATSSNVSEDGYPLMNPYKFVSKKEASPQRQVDSYAGYEPQQQQQQTKKHNFNPVEYDSYNLKFNNNPEGYGYQQTYKSQVSNRHSPGKRGKRGGNQHSAGGHKKSAQRPGFTDLEANMALRPPPKQ